MPSVEPKIEGELRTADGYWTVQVVRYRRTETWFRVWHATTVVEERASLASVQRILGEDFATLRPVAGDGEAGAGSSARPG